MDSGSMGQGPACLLQPYDTDSDRGRIAGATPIVVPDKHTNREKFGEDS